MTKSISEMKSETILEMNKWNEEAGERIDKLEKLLKDLFKAAKEALPLVSRHDPSSGIFQRLDEAVSKVEESK